MQRGTGTIIHKRTIMFIRPLFILMIYMFSSFTQAGNTISCRDKNGEVVFTDGKSFCHEDVKTVTFDKTATTLNGAKGFTFDVNYEDPFNDIPDKKLFTENIKAAGEMWSKYIQGGAHIETLVKVVKDNRGGTTANSTYSSLYTETTKRRIFEVGLLHQIRTGKDKNGSKPDLLIQIVKAGLNRLWLDPQPTRRSMPVPKHRTDAITVFMHELGHALGFSGWINLKTRTSKHGKDYTTFDKDVIFVNNAPYYTGKLSNKLYGQPIPLITRTTYSHIGDDISNGHRSLKKFDYEWHYF